jgi:hypothetical protein
LVEPRKIHPSEASAKLTLRDGDFATIELNEHQYSACHGIGNGISVNKFLRTCFTARRYQEAHAAATSVRTLSIAAMISAAIAKWDAMDEI